ncbi:uncharacterized protein [Gossypium hirsutum]|uniref:Uncharacterized protein n=1 Tax=Gossypium hirsutum TaxID=3635 RepID=A0ABM3BJE2_GOSHI|nr:uncharacterized protein LOC121228102 [Gossypium hirsutum]
MAKYEAKFLRLSHYARGMVASKYKRCIRFEDGVRDKLRVLITPHRERNFSTLVEKAKIAEEVKHAEHQNRDLERGKNKRDSEPSSSTQRPKKKARTNGPIRAGPFVTITGLQPCTDYGRRHQGKCWRRTGACLRCGSLKHCIRECLLRANQMQALGTGTAQPQRGVQQPPRVHGQAKDGNGMGRGQRVPSRDIGSTHSYIASNISGNLGISVESTTSEVRILSLLGQSVRVSKLYRNIPLEVQGAIFLADLIELPFGEFNLILGMDWLVKHHVSLDCATKRVVPMTEEDKEVVMIEERYNYLSNVISVVRKDVRHS